VKKTTTLVPIIPVAPVALTEALHKTAGQW
jgi:hypothetical protein